MEKNEVDFDSQFCKAFSCLFSPDVLCSYVKSEKFVGVMDRCMKCSHYERLLREMDDEDEKVMDEIDRMHAWREGHG